MAFKIGKNFKQKEHTHDESHVFTENLRSLVTDYSGITYIGILDELPDVNESKYGQLVILNDNKNSVYLFNGVSWQEFNTHNYDVNISVPSENTNIDTYGNKYWNECYDNIASVKITNKNYLLSDVNCL